MAGQPKARTIPRVEPWNQLTRTSIMRDKARLRRSIERLEHIERIYDHRMFQLLLLQHPLQASATDGVGGRSGIPDPTSSGGEYAYYAMLASDIASSLAGVCAGIDYVGGRIDAVPTGLDTALEASRIECRVGPAASRDEFPWLEEGEDQCHRLDVNGRLVCEMHRQRDEHYWRVLHRKATEGEIPWQEYEDAYRKREQIRPPRSVTRSQAQGA
jgi:hypothetical protein